MGLILSTENMNIVEAAKRAGYAGRAEFLANIAQKNDFLQYAPWYPSSNGTYHKWLEAKRAGEGGFRSVNGPVPSISSQSDFNEATVALYEADSEVDERVISTAEDGKKARDSEDVANLEGFTQGWLDALVHGSTSLDAFKGLAARRNAIDNEYTFSGDGAALSTTNTSLWLFEFGEMGFNLRYPKGMMPGISSSDRGLHKLPLADGGANWRWVRNYVIAAAIELKKEKAMLRMADIPTTGTDFAAATFIKMKNQLPSLGKNAMGFANRTLHALIENHAYAKTNMAYTIEDVKNFGPVLKVVGIPIMYMEVITDDETALASS